jgi:hypothetical protein
MAEFNLFLLVGGLFSVLFLRFFNFSDGVAYFTNSLSFS